MKQYLVIYLTKVTIKDFKGKYRRSHDYKKNPKLSIFNIKKFVFLSNQKHNKDNTKHRKLF